VVTGGCTKTLLETALEAGLVAYFAGDILG
jgi:hypothetical protein